MEAFLITGNHLSSFFQDIIFNILKNILFNKLKGPTLYREILTGLIHHCKEEL